MFFLSFFLKCTSVFLGVSFQSVFLKVFLKIVFLVKAPMACARLWSLSIVSFFSCSHFFLLKILFLSSICLSSHFLKGSHMFGSSVEQ